MIGAYMPLSLNYIKRMCLFWPGTYSTHCPDTRLSDELAQLGIIYNNVV